MKMCLLILVFHFLGIYEKYKMTVFLILNLLLVCRTVNCMLCSNLCLPGIHDVPEVRLPDGQQEGV